MTLEVNQVLFNDIYDLVWEVSKLEQSWQWDAALELARKGCRSLGFSPEEILFKRIDVVVVKDEPALIWRKDF